MLDGMSREGVVAFDIVELDVGFKVAESTLLSEAIDEHDIDKRSDNLTK
jgi:hypothetical protein